MWTLVLDSTSLVADFRVRSPTTVGLFDRAAAGKLSIVVPEIVVREVVGKFKQELKDARSHLVRARSKFVRLGVPLDVPDLDVDALGTEYEQYLRSTFERIGAEIPSPPDITHLELVDRAIAQRKPFRESGTGYRDALIWETVVRYAAASDVTFVTDNHRDFAESNDDVSLVAPALRQDLTRIGKAHDRVLVCRNTAAAIDYLFLRDEVLLETLRADPPFSSLQFLAVLDPVIALRVVPELALPERAEVLGITGVEPLPDWVPVFDDAEEGTGEAERDALRVIEAKHLQDDRAILEIEVPVSATIEFFMPASAVDAREHMRNFSVEEFDTGQDSVVLCSAGRDIDLRFRASFNTATREVTGIQLGSVEVRTRAMASRNAHLLGLRPGDVVKHARFGLGVIRALVGEGERSEAVVEFEAVGEKRLLLAWAPLERA